MATRIFIAIILSLLSTSLANADVCTDLRGQLTKVGSATTDSATLEVRQLSRQLSALKNLQRQRQCSGKGSGGLFDACGDISSRISAVQNEIARAGRGFGGASVIQAKLSALGCASQQARSARTAGPAYSSAPTMLFCVRLSDGYYFPAPNSQFVGEASYKETLDRCRYICAENGMDVYALDDAALESEEMLSIKGRSAYKDLPAAFAYREATNFRSCDLQRYSRRVSEARARTVTPTNMKNAIIPLPSLRPELIGDAVASGAPPATGQTTALGYAESRKVRVVGPVFLPQD